MSASIVYMLSGEFIPFSLIDGKLLYHDVYFTNTKRQNSKCKDFNQLYIPLTWENLYHFGSDEQRSLWNDFRMKIVTLLFRRLRSICKENNLNAPKVLACEPVKVGTSKNITFASDIDIDLNITSTHHVNLLFDVINRYETKVLAGHKFDVLFDTNFYASFFDFKWCNKACRDKDLIKEQRLWSFTRVVQVLDNKQYTRMVKNIFFDTPILSSLWGETKHLLSSYDTDDCNYVSSVANYIESKRNLKTKLSLYSATKLCEHETYRSIGAYMDIVKNDKTLPASMYIDSMLDNLGFAVACLVHSPPCFSTTMEYKVMRLAKYLQRICKAWYTISVNDVSTKLTIGRIERIESICDTINSHRKQLKSLDTQIVMSLYKCLGIRLRNGQDILSPTYRLPLLQSLLKLVCIELYASSSVL